VRTFRKVSLRGSRAFVGRVSDEPGFTRTREEHHNEGRRSERDASGRQGGRDSRVERRPRAEPQGYLNRVLPDERDAEQRIAGAEQLVGPGRASSRAPGRACRRRGRPRVPSARFATTRGTCARSRAGSDASRLRPPREHQTMARPAPQRIRLVGERRAQCGRDPLVIVVGTGRGAAWLAR
jgi:hypothetical protein